jgi:hypothetical protein
MMDDRKQKEKRKNNGDEELMMALQKQHHSKKWNGYTGPSLSNTMLVLSCIPSSAPIKFIFRTQQ